MIKRIFLFFTVLFITSHSTVFSQTITASTLKGCVPLNGVMFTGVAGAVNPLWDFGDGASSPFPNPSHSYITKGTYTVKYTANGGINQSLTIVVNGNPTPKFTATSATKGCVGLAVTFQDNSTGGGGSAITNWKWTYGDGGSNSVNSASQTYVYNISGQFSVTVIVTDANGCDSSLKINNLVTVSQPPSISVSPISPSACVPPLTVSFTSSGTSHSPLGTALNYLWTFSGSGTSTLSTPPAQTYSVAGVFPVKVKITDANNCADSVLTNVTIQKPIATFTTSTKKDTLCLNAVFDPTGSSAGSQNWNYGDGTTGGGTAHTYTAGGIYTVSLTVSNGACNDVATHTVFVEDPIANFSVIPTFMCSLPKTVSLTNSSTSYPGTTYHWGYFQSYTQYGLAPKTSTQTSPTFTLTHLDTNRYTINKLDIMDSISLLITTPQGCTSHKSFLLIDTIFLPTARFLPSVYQGCVPLKVNFTDSSVVGPIPKEHITSWKYIFGDGGSKNLAASPANTIYTYTATGIYYPTLVIQTQDGCIDTSYAIKIEVGSPPVASFSVSPTTVCIGDNVQLTNTTPTSYSVDTWHYYGDGNYYASSCTNSSNVSWPFTHATGPQSISMVACFRGCCDSVTPAAGVITVKGPLATFSTAMNCDSSHIFHFTGTISDATNWSWNFGDGNVVGPSTASTISNTYAATGDYTVTLTATSATTGCSPFTYTVPVHVRDIKSNFTYDTLLCSGISHSFDGSISTDVYTYGNNGYIWLWGDGSSPDITATNPITHSFSGHGTYTVSLITKDINSCPDTVKKIIKAYSVTRASFKPSPDTLCLAGKVNTVTFTNYSTADLPIKTYNWSFGDGVTSTATNPTHTYTVVSTTNITAALTVIDSLGCQLDTQVVLHIANPSAIFSITSVSNICAGDSVKFQLNGQATPYPSMTWSFGDGSMQGPTPPKVTTAHQYTVSGSWPVILNITDAAGCIASYTATQTINVQNIPQIKLTSLAFTSSKLCAPQDFLFYDSTQLNPGDFLSRNWNLYDGSPLITSTPVAKNYTIPGTYSVTLIETTTYHCSDTVTKTFKVSGPVGDFTSSPSTICKGQSITFSIKDTSDVSAWTWDFGDGIETDTAKVSPISHVYNFHPPSGKTHPTVTFFSNDGCNHPAEDTIYIYQVIADFNRNNELTKLDTAHCLGPVDVFHNISTGADSYGWNFGDGSTALNVMDPTHTYTVANTYTVELFIKNNATSCVDTMYKKMYIYPAFVEVVSGNDSICQAQSETLTAAGTGISYNWAPAAGLSSTAVSNPLAAPTITTTYTLVATDINGCVDTATAFVFVQQPPKPITWDTTIVIGQVISLPGGQGPGFTYTWTPTNNLSCINCAVPVFNGTVNTNYTEVIADNRHCFKDSSTFNIIVEPLSSIDVPTAFTPNGDGTNDVVYVAGWGLKSLQYFKIFNRWGELVFETNDIKVGWDGTYKGTPQNIETYVYQVSAETYISKDPIIKKGYIKLLR
jgi:gliding motility-associated-like protein